MTTVTIRASNGFPEQTINFKSGSPSLALAQSIADTINAAPFIPVVVLNTGGINNTGSPFVVINGNMPATVIGLADQDIIGDSQGTSYTAATNSTDLIALAGGANTITAGTGSFVNIATGIGNDAISIFGSGTIHAGRGANTIVAAGNSSTSALIFADGNKDVMAITNGNATVNEAGSNAIIAGGNGRYVFSVSGANDTIASGSGPATLFGAANTTLLLGSGANIVHASKHADGSDTIFANSGASTIYGGTSDDIVSNSNNLTFIGDTGAERLDASRSTAGLNIKAGSGNATLTGGSGNDTFFGGSGHDILTGGAGENTFAFAFGTAAGTETITDFKQGTNADQVVLSGYGANEVSTALATAVISGGNTTITLPDQTKVIFAGVTSLNANNFSGL